LLAVALAAIASLLLVYLLNSSIGGFHALGDQGGVVNDRD